MFVVLLPFLVIFWASFLPFFAAPSWDAVQKLSLDNYRYLNGFRPFWDALKNSVLLATLTATMAMLLTSLVAWIVYKSRLPGAWILDFLAFVPITIPGIVMGMSLILLVRCISDSDLWYDLGVTDRLRNAFHPLRYARRVRLDTANSQRAGRGCRGVRRFLVGNFSERDVAASAAGASLLGGFTSASFRSVSFPRRCCWRPVKAEYYRFCCLPCSNKAKLRSWQPLAY